MPSPSQLGTSVVVGFDFDVPCGPVINVPPSGPDTHLLPQREARNQQMAAQFLATGVVDDRCLGAGCYPS